MQRKIVGILIALSIPVLLMILTVSLLKDDKKYYVSGDYIFLKTGKKYYIDNFSEEGKEKEILILPSTFKGHTLSGLGYSRAFYHAYRSRLVSPNLKRLYINDLPIKGDSTELFRECPKLEVIICKTISNITDHPNAHMFADEYRPLLNYDETAQRKTNVHFYLEPDDDCYWYDYYNDSLITYKPADPTKDGYIFKGWYKDKECTDDWDFDNDKVPLQEEWTIYKYIELKLYAKWELI